MAEDNWWANDAEVPTGDAYLKTLDPARRAQVKALAEGRMELPKGAALRSAETQALLADAAQYDPSFDVVNAPARIAARKAFTSGKQSQNVTSLNTAIGHIGTLAQRAEELDNGSLPAWNSIANAAEAATGDPRRSNFNIARDAVVDELERVFRGTGGNLATINEWKANINAAQSPAQLRGAIRQAGDLLHSRVEALGDSYSQAMGTTQDPFTLLNPHAREALAKFQSDDYIQNGPAAPMAPVAPSEPPSNGGGGAIATGQYRTKNDADTSALIDKMIRSGATAEQINARIQPLGFIPVDQARVSAAQQYVKSHPNYKGLLGEATKTVEQSVGNQIAGSGIGSAAIAGANTALFGTLPKIGAAADAIGGRLSGDNRAIGDIYNDSLDANNLKIAQSRAAHPGAALAGDVAGFIGGDALLGAVPAVGALARRLPGAVRPAVGDALFGAATGAGSSDSLAELPSNVAKGAALTAAGGVLGRGAVRGIGALASPVANAAVQRLTNAGVTLTPGQILGAGGGVLGRAVKGVEDRLAGFPVIGDVINSTRRTGNEEFNRAAINDALRPINQVLPDDVAVGHQGIQHAQQAVSDAYNAALPAMNAVPDAQFAADLSAVSARARTLSPEGQARFTNIMDNDVQPYVAGRQALDGRDIQSLKQGLDTRIGNLRGQGSTPQDRDLADHLSDVRDAILDVAGRTNPAASAQFEAANNAFSLLSRVEGAAAKGRDGVFTPNMFRQAVTKRGYGTSTRTVAAGTSRMQELATDASTILPNAVPDSGTAGRAALGVLAGRLAPGATLGGAAGYEQGGGEGALLGALAGGALLSRPGARAVQWTLAGSRGQTANTLGTLLRANANLGGAVGAPLLLSPISNKGN